MKNDLKMVGFYTTSYFITNVQAVLKHKTLHVIPPKEREGTLMIFVRKSISLTPPRWVSHKCTFKGCSEGFAVLDGNEVNRTVCAAPRSCQRHLIRTPPIQLC